MALEHTHTFPKIQFLVLMFCFKFMPWSLYMIQFLQILYLIYIKCIYLSSMILSHISLQNYFENFQVQKNFHSENCFRPGGRPGRSTGPIPGQDGRPPRSTASCVQDVHACARLSVDRPVDRPKTACSLFFVGRPTGRPPVVCPLRPVDRAQRLYANWATGRPTGRPIAYLEPQRLFPLW